MINQPSQDHLEYFIYEGEIGLRPYRLQDADRFIAWINNPEVYHHFPLNRPLDRVDAVKVIEQSIRGMDRHGFIVVLLPNQWEVGLVELNEIDRTNRKCELEITIGEPTAWDQGYGSRALMLILCFAFRYQNMHRVSLHVMENNHRARHVYEKAGFQKEGLLRDNGFKNGLYYNEVVYSILESEYRARELALP